MGACLFFSRYHTVLAVKAVRCSLVPASRSLYVTVLVPLLRESAPLRSAEP
jgi:hypothetical protein